MPKVPTYAQQLAMTGVISISECCGAPLVANDNLTQTLCIKCKELIKEQSL